MFELTYLSLSTDIALARMFGRAYENSLWRIYKLFSAYFHKLSIIGYENSLELLKI
jgi:hypothetical protein